LKKNIKNAFSNFIDFTDSEWLEISKLFIEKKYDKGEFFIQEGEYCNYVGFIDKGLFSYYYLIDGNRSTRQFFFANNFISNYSCFLSNEKSKAIIQALEKSSVTLIHKSSLSQLYQNFPKFQQLGRMITENLFLIISEKYESFLLESAEERYLNLIENRPKVIQNIPQYMIASYLGITPEGLSRIRKRLARR
jgi:CRP-like cAMP-binding protein